MKKAFSLIGVIFLSAGCEQSSAPSPATVYASAEKLQLKITNTTGAAVYYIVFESSILPYIDWAPFCRENNSILPNSTVSIPFVDTTFLPSNQAVVYWWHKGAQYENSELFGADSVRVITVSIQ